MYNWHFTLHTVHLFISHSTFYTPHPTLFTPHATLLTPQYTLYTSHFTFYTLHFRMHTTNTLHTLLHTAFHTPLHTTLHILNSTRSTPHFASSFFFRYSRLFGLNLHCLHDDFHSRLDVHILYTSHLTSNELFFGFLYVHWIRGPWFFLYKSNNSLIVISELKFKNQKNITDRRDGSDGLLICLPVCLFS